MTRIAEHAVVVGAGIGGLAAAAATSPYFDRITVVERDALPTEAAWRIGVPQCRHAHALLLGGLEAMGELLPGFADDLERAGAVPFQISLDFQYEQPGYDPVPRRDLGLPPAYSMTRPLLELTARRRVEGLGNVRVRDRTKVSGLAWDGARVTGVRLGDGEETLPADLVIDASGRGAPTLDLMRQLGLPTPAEDVTGVNATYATVIVAKPDGWVDDWRTAITLSQPPHDRRGSFCFSVEGRCWIATVTEMHGGDPPETWDAFLEAARGLRTQTVYNAVSQGAPVGEVMRFKRAASTRRHFEQLASVPAGVVAFGDAVCQFNPIYGQGMTVAAQQARLLGQVLGERSAEPDPVCGLPEAFYARTPEVTTGPWEAARGYDFQFPETTGEPPPDYAGATRFMAGLTELCARDPEVHRLFQEVANCLRSGSVYQEPAFAARVMAVAAELQPA